ncbi:hypothetical protein ANCDUO_03063 [Ancylostoma duodenale]|uniref:tRNA synthetases class I (E and Q) anti-codon binding domain-containing protein n=1 Tax=Ancylostoma duodenale TaxID=51022 RepID=A0A0C2GYM9_9BILA|nr:hypothetical protein ANCDUO_03063 [Ancylostoma duodenale]
MDTTGLNKNEEVSFFGHLELKASLLAWVHLLPALPHRKFVIKSGSAPHYISNNFISALIAEQELDSLTVLYTVLIDKSIAHSKVYDRYQFERVGYFSVDPDTVPGKHTTMLHFIVSRARSAH